MASPQHRIFVSHSSKDHDFCLRLIDDLQEALGDESAVWYDARGGLHGGDTWWRTIVEEIKARDVFLIVLSPHSVASSWVNSEFDLAWRQKHSPTGKLIIPLLYQECDYRDDIGILQIIRFVEPRPYETAFQELLVALGLAASKGKQAVYTLPPPPVPTQKTRDQWFQEGYDHVEAKRYGEAVEAYSRAIALDPNYAEAYYNRGLAYYYRHYHYYVKEYERAIADFDQAIRLDPNYAKAYYSRGLAYQGLHQYWNAVADYDQAIRLDPSYAKTYYNPNYAVAYHGRGNAYFDLKEYQKAIADYDQAIRLDPNNTLAKKYRERAYSMLNQKP